MSGVPMRVVDPITGVDEIPGVPTALGVIETLPDYVDLEGDAIVGFATHDDEVVQVLRVLRTVEQARESLKRLAGVLEAEVVNRLGRDRLVVEGLGSFERKPGTSRTQWQTAELRKVIPQQIAADPETGEINRDRFEAAELAIGAAGSSWRSGGLRVIGLNPDLYCRAEPGNPRLVCEWATEHEAVEQ